MLVRIRRRRWDLVGVVTIVGIIVLARAAVGENSVTFRKGLECTILKGTEQYMTVDLAEYTTMGEAILGIRQPHMRPISPDGRYIPFVIQKGNPDADILLIDLRDKAVRRQKMYENIYAFLAESMEWITPTKIGVRHRLPVDKYIVYDLKKKESKLLTGESSVVWDSTGVKHAAVFGKRGWYGGRRVPLRIPEKRLGVSEALRYNSYWVYPVAVEGPVTRAEYERWQSDIGIREAVASPTEKPPLVRTNGVSFSANHVLSITVFLGDTSWVGFFEQIYPLNKYNEVIESNAVILDGHEVCTNPPEQEKVHVKKQRITSIVPKSQQEYIDLAVNLTAQWNSETSCLELWRTTGWRYKLKKKKLGEVPIDLTTVELGSYRSVQSDWLPATIAEDR